MQSTWVRVMACAALETNANSELALADDWMKNNVNLLYDRRAYHLHVLAKKKTRTRRPNWACQEVAVHLATCGLNHCKALHHPHCVRVLSTLTSSIFSGLVRSGVERSTASASLSFIQVLFLFLSQAALRRSRATLRDFGCRKQTWKRSLLAQYFKWKSYPLL